VPGGARGRGAGIRALSGALPSCLATPGIFPPAPRAAPSTFVIYRQRIVPYVSVGASAADRPHVREVLQAVRKVAGGSTP
jgi:hypothetical protein